MSRELCKIVLLANLFISANSKSSRILYGVEFTQAWILPKISGFSKLPGKYIRKVIVQKGAEILKREHLNRE